MHHRTHAAPCGTPAFRCAPRCAACHVADARVCVRAGSAQPLLEFPAVTICNNNALVATKLQDPSHPVHPILDGRPPRHFTVEQVRANHTGTLGRMVPYG